MVGDAGVISTSATMVCTVTLVVALFPSAAAVIPADPWRRPVTVPLEETMAISGSLVVQVTPRSVRMSRLASRRTRVSWRS
jgi:hypothetical protein